MAVKDPVPVAIPSIKIDGGTQQRASINESIVAEYAEQIKAGDTFSPVTVFFDGTDYWLADGFHRYHAHRLAGLDEISCDVRTGTSREAILFSVGANDTHGLRRTNEDKQKAIATLLSDPEWSLWSDREIARACRVSDKTVGAARQARQVRNSALAESGQTKAEPEKRKFLRGGKEHEHIAERRKDKPATPEATKPSEPETTNPADSTTTVVNALEGIAENLKAENNLLSELEAADKEIRRLNALVESLSKSDLAAEVASWHLKFDQLNGRLQQAITTGNEAQKQAVYYGKVLTEIKKIVGVEKIGQIAAAVMQKFGKKAA